MGQTAKKIKAMPAAQLCLREREKRAPIIYVYRNALLDSVRAKLLKCIANGGTWEQAAWRRYADHYTIGKIELENRDVRIKSVQASLFFDLSQWQDALNRETHELFKTSFTDLSAFTACKYTTGCHIRAHSDGNSSSGRRLFTFVLFLLNDAQGGALHFPQFNLELVANRSELIMFPSEVIHGVRHVTSGERITLVWFGEMRQ